MHLIKLWMHSIDGLLYSFGKCRTLKLCGFYQPNSIFVRILANSIVDIRLNEVNEGGLIQYIIVFSGNEDISHHDEKYNQNLVDLYISTLCFTLLVRLVLWELLNDVVDVTD